MKKVGFTIGKFAPLHKGHEYLIEKGMQEMDEFYVVVYETDLIEITLKKRGKWIEDLYPGVKILYAINPPSKYGLDPESINVQMEYLSGIIKKVNPTHFYSSEKYGEHVAKYLQIQEVLVDKARVNIPISASKIRQSIEEYKVYLSEIVYKELL